MSGFLIITEDIVKTQTLTGILGKTYSFIYLHWLKLRLKLAIFFSRPFTKVTILTSDYFQLNHPHALYYGRELAKINYADNRQAYWQITNKLLRQLAKPHITQLFQTRLAIFLTYNYFIYADLYQKIISQTKPNKIIVLGNSHHEQTVKFIAKLNKIPTLTISLLSLVPLSHWLKHFFLNREYQQKINNFVSQAKFKPPSKAKLNQACLLSLDFFRHLKTLAPIYLHLDQQNKNPWLVTDITNLDQSLANLKIPQANHLYLASFLTQKFISQKLLAWQTAVTKDLNQLSQPQPTNLNSFLCRLGIQAAKPLIKHSLVLSRLYLVAGKKLFQTAKPKGLIVVSDVRFCELALSYLAKKHQVRSVLVSPNTILSQDELNPYNTTDKVTVVGDFARKKLLNLGIDRKKIHIVGDPRLENYQALSAKLDKKAVYQKLGLKDLSKKIILLISFRSTWMIPKTEKQAFLQMAYQAVKNLKNSVLVIKPHPTEKRYRVLEEVSQWGIKNIIVSDNNQLELIELLNASSIILQTWSMTIFEAIMMNRPVIAINPEKKDYNFFIPVLKPGGGIEVTSQKDLSYWLRVLINPTHPKTKIQLKKAKQACTQFIKPPDGQVAQRVAKLFS